jgi:hypothetical protein
LPKITWERTIHPKLSISSALKTHCNLQMQLTIAAISTYSDIPLNPNNSALFRSFYSENHHLLLISTSRTHVHCRPIFQKCWFFDSLWFQSNEKCLVIYADNVRPYNTRKSQIFWKANSLRRVPYLPYSPDSALSDLFLSDYMKYCLKMSFFCSIKKLLIEIHDILMGNHWSPYWLYLKTRWRDSSEWPHIKVITIPEIKLG